MKSLLDQIFSLGIGAAVVSKEQIENVVNELVAKGEVSRKESKDMIDHLVEKGETAKKDLDDMVKSKVQQTLKELNLVTMEEYQELKNRVAKLEGKSE